MGLLDALFNSDTYGGQGGGLLDLIRSQSQYMPSQAPAQDNQPAPLDSARWPAGPVGAPSSAPPVSFADRFNALPNAAPIAVGDYQMPRIGPVSQFASDPSLLPQNATSTQGALPQGQPPQMAPAQQPQPSPQQEQALPPALAGLPAGNFLDKINAGLQSLGHGGSIIGALTGNRTDPQSIAQQNLTGQYQAVRQTLLQSGLSPQEANSKAMLAVMNPEAGKTILSEALTNREKWGEIGTDALGNKQMGFINERDQTVNGKPLGAEGAASSGSAGGFLAPGVKQIDSSLQGQDYLKQFSPEVQAAVQNYVDGKSTPTGNPRKGFTQTVKMIAQKYGADTGQSVDDATYSARRTMRNQLSSSAPASLGGQINIGNTAAGHLADLSQKAIELGNVDTGIAPLTAAVNGVRGLGTEQAAKMEALKGAAQHYGQEITKFYAGSPGGTAERDRFIESVNGARSPKELAAILATEGELMRSRLDALGGQIRGVLGEEGAKEYPVLRPDGQAALAKVEQNVSRLKGGQAAPSGGIPAGWSVKVH